MDQPTAGYLKYQPTAIPQVAGRTYNNFKTYIGATQLPSFSLGTTIFPTFDLSKNVDVSKELKFNTLTFAVANLPTGPWPTNAAYTCVIPCPEGVEHLYQSLSIRFDPTAASATITSKYNLYVSSEAPIPTTANGFSVSSNPAFIPTLVQISAQDTAVAEYVLTRTNLPIYVPPKGFLIVFPKDMNNGSGGFPTGANLFVTYQRIERTAGVGPLVY